MIKDSGWIFADYIWNENQTEAEFSLDGVWLISPGFKTELKKPLIIGFRARKRNLS